MQRQRKFQSKEFISIETQGGEVFHFDVNKVTTYSLKSGDLKVVLEGNIELPKAKDAAEIEKFIEQIERIR